jgi:hypothetical protein
MGALGGMCIDIGWSRIVVNQKGRIYRLISNMTKTALIFVFMVIAILCANAQKLPNVQKVSLYAPSDVKIDGIASEWNNKVQAYNRATSIFYTMANDDDNLYLIIQVKDPLIINKVISAGITFTINKNNKRDVKNAPSITYPVFEKDMKANISLKNKPELDPQSPASVLRADSFMNANNKRLTDKSKYIMITGMKGLDSLISVYNTDGIKTAGLFDNQMVYTCELAIPLKFLEISSNTNDKFEYNIRSNELNTDNLNGLTVKTDADGFPTSVAISSGALIPKKANWLELQSSTDFWGEYSLAKKP